jgi:lipopolysaccharide/colanic/teichoic acid biosynthesis glycosyltransferase/nucleoside-diphosphate-sugar epimerase
MVLVTGATGFVGRALVQALLASHQPVVAATRHFSTQTRLWSKDVRLHAVGDINCDTQWETALHGVNTVVHCAARTNVMREEVADALAVYREGNVAGTLQLARQAVVAGVRRFVFLSSIKVNGEATLPRQPFNEQSAIAPQDAYGQSKAEAERALMDFAALAGLEVVIIRPPLVYGPGVKGNFAGMAKAIQCGFPLPLGAVRNQRSLLALDNLVSLVLLCADRARSPQAANQVFVVADGHDVSTTELLRKVAHASGRPSRLLPIPVGLLQAGASLLLRRALSDRLLSNLQVDDTKVRTLLGWHPVVTMDEQLAAMFALPSNRQGALLRWLDVVLSATGLLVLWPLMLLACFVSWLDTRSPLFVQKRVGRFERPFTLVKFRTMRPDTASVATHLADASAITLFGSFLRRTKFDELPQLWNVLRGDMSLVGPRPCLFNQQELIAQRAELNVFAARPGITGLAQIQGIDMSSPELLAKTDAQMLGSLTARDYFRYIFLTVLGRGSGDRVRR